MNNYNDKRAFIEAALIAAITTVLAMSVIYIPVLSISTVLIPVPFMILAYRHGTKSTILSFITFSLLIGILTEVLYTVFLILTFGPMIISMGYYIRKRKEPYVAIGVGTITYILSIFIVFQFVSYIGNINIIDEIGLVMEDVIAKQVDMLKTMNVDVLSAEEVLNYLLMIIPGVLIIQSMFTAFGNYYLTVGILKRLSPNDLEFPQFSNFRLPGNIVLGSFIIFILSYLTRYIEGVYHVSLITNVTLLFVFLFFIQGISVISYLIKRTKTPKPVRIFLLALILLISPLLTAISFLGLIDSIVDIRKAK